MELENESNESFGLIYLSSNGLMQHIVLIQFLIQTGGK